MYLKSGDCMTKILVIPSSIKMLNELINKCDGFIVGMKDFSVNVPISFSIEELKNISKICKDNNKELFVSVNKNIHNSELESLLDVLKELSTLDITGIMFYDIAVLNLNNKFKLNLNLVWSQEHLTTNYATCNFWNSYGVNSVYLSSDITLDEIIDIKNNIKMNTFVNVFGYLPMFASRRHLVKNYLDTFNLIDNSSAYKICKEGKKYTIVDNNLGSLVYSSNILNGLDEMLILKENNINYVVLNSFDIVDSLFTEVVNLFTNVTKDNVKSYNNKINEMFDNIDKGFLYKETVYKVKNNE